jgi:hypothetical protein
MKLYRSRNYPNRWYAYSDSMGWVMFPAETGGWEKRQPARGIDPIDIREVPVHLAFDAGIPGSPNALPTPVTADSSFSEAA